LKGAEPYRQELTPISFIERAGSSHSTRTAVVDGDRRFTYGEWRSRCRRLASSLRAAGLQKGDRVGFLALNSEPLLLAHFAVPMAGGVLVAINSRLSAPEVAYIVEHAGARTLFYSPELTDQVANVPNEVSTVALTTEFERLVDGGSDEPLEIWLQDEYEPISINYTSGTTGRPKGVVYHHRGAFLNALAMTIESRLTPDSRMLWTLPMFHCGGWSHTWAVAAAGSSSVCIPKADPGRIWDLLRSERITHFNAAPTVLIALANHPAARPLSPSVRACTGGAAPTPALIAQMDSLNIELVHAYGLTETYGPLTFNLEQPGLSERPPEERARFKARQGLPHIAAGGVRVVDEGMRDVPADGATMGEVVAAGNTVMSEYYRDPEATAAAFFGGWLHTGDLGVLHSDGYVEIRDRKKDIVISGGENVSTIEVENILSSHPTVMECAVVAVPDAFWGEVPKAFVTLKAGATATEAELIEYCRSRMAHFKCPKMIEFGELPKTSTGKIQKFALRERSRSL
jgi:fatty-acyl-CoA synthase